MFDAWVPTLVNTRSQTTRLPCRKDGMSAAQDSGGKTTTWSCPDGAVLVALCSEARRPRLRESAAGP